MNSFSQSYFLHEKKNVVVYKLSSCFNTSEFLLLGRVRVRGMGQGGCVGQTFQSENWCLAFKGLITHIPLASDRIISHVGAVFREEVVWLYESCCCQYRWRNATLPEFTAPVTLSCTAYVNPQLHVMPSNSGPKDEKIKPEDEHFLPFLSFRRELLSKIPSL